MSRYRNILAVIAALCASVAAGGMFGAGTNRTASYVTYGTNAVTAVYCGSNLVWSSTPSIVYAPASDFTYTTNAGQITITGYVGTGGQVNIPPTINGFPVVAIDQAPGSFSENGFAQNANLKGVDIPDSVSSVGYATFYACGITNLVIGSGLRNVADLAFGQCGGLKTIVIKDGLEELGIGMFAYGTFTSIVLPASITNLKNYSFQFNGYLTAVYFLGNLPTFGVTVFDPSTPTLYRTESATGWGTPPDTVYGLPTAYWYP